MRGCFPEFCTKPLRQGLLHINMEKSYGFINRKEGSNRKRVWCFGE